MKNWYHNPRNNSSQGLVIEEGTGRTVAVAYDPKDTPLLAAAPDLLATLIEAREVLAVALSWPGSESLRSRINVAIMKTEAAQRVPERRHVGDYELYDRGCPDCP